MDNQISSLCNQDNFYPVLTKDMLNAEKEVVIYSPFISRYRADLLTKTFKELIRRNITIFIFTRAVKEHELHAQDEIQVVINEYRKLGIHVFCLNGFIHEKVAIIDQKVLWEGSLNILSQRNSREIMRRFANADLSKQVLKHLDIMGKLKAGYRQAKHVNPISKTEKIIIDVIVPIINWWFSALIKVIILMLKGIMAIFSIVNVILR